MLKNKKERLIKSSFIGIGIVNLGIIRTVFNAADNK